MITVEYPPVTDSLLSEIVRKIVEAFHPEKIILFGSRAWGSARQDSDVDMLVVMETDLRPARRSAEISLACRPRGLAMDILVKTPAEIDDRTKIGDPFLRRVLEQGKVLYAR